MTKLRIHLHDPLAKAPTYANSDDSGSDLYSIQEVELQPGEIKLVDTGVSFEIPENYEIQIRPKSGLALKHGITVLNTPGTVDESYRNTVKVILINLGQSAYKIEVGHKIAQMILTPVVRANIVVMDESVRGLRGFGSSGV